MAFSFCFSFAEFQLEHVSKAFHITLGYGKAIAWIDYGPEVNTVWKVVLYESGKPRNFYDDEVLVYPNAMDAEDNKLVIPQNWKQ